MRIFASLKIAARALRRNKMRSLLTMLGVIIGVGAVIGAVSLTSGATKQVEDQVSSLGERAGHHPNQLSGGQQQRVAIARALVNRPALLLADEPTGNLDSQTSIEIMGVFQKLNEQGITLVMVTHELDVARFTKRMVILRDGKIVTDEAVPNRSIAEKELQRLRQEQQAVKLG